MKTAIYKVLNTTILSLVLLFLTGCQSGCQDNHDGYYAAGAPRPPAYDPAISEGVEVIGDIKENEIDTIGGKPFNTVEFQNIKMPRVYFGYDQYNIPQQEQQKLANLGNWLLEYSYVGIRIEGHCDERGSTEYNRALGERRALSVKKFLKELGVQEARMQTISYGEEKLLDSNDTKEGHARNRRTEFVIGRLQ